MKRALSITVSGIVLATLLVSHSSAQNYPAAKELSPEVAAAILGDSIPRTPRPARTVQPVRRQPSPGVLPARVPATPNAQRAKTVPAEKRVTGVTTVLTTPSELSAKQQAMFQPFQLGGSKSPGKVGVSRFANTGMRPDDSGNVPVTPSVVPKYTQDQRAILLEQSVRERTAARDSQSYGSGAFGVPLFDYDQPSGNGGSGEKRNNAESSTEQNPAPIRPTLSTALPANFGANRLAQPTTGVARSGGPSIQGPALARRATGIPRSPKILPAGQGRRSSARFLRSRGGGGGCGGG